MSIFTKRNAFFCFIFFLITTNICFAEIKPDKNNIVKDVTELTDLYETIIPVGADAPSFKLKDLDGKAWDSDEFIRKNVTMLYFWSAFCPYCKESLPKVNKVYNKFKNKGLKALVVNLDGIDFSNAIKSFLNDGNINVPAPLDYLYQKKFFAAGDPYGVNKTPTLFLINKDGKIIYNAEVDIDYEHLEKLIEKNTKNVKKIIIIILIAFGGILILSLIVYIVFIRPNIVEQKIIDDLKRRTQDELHEKNNS